MPTIERIARFDKRITHFIGDYRGDWREMPEIKPVGIGITAHNYALAQSLDDTYTDRLFWLDATADAFGRYMDANRIAGDWNAIGVLMWWRSNLFFDARSMVA